MQPRTHILFVLHSMHTGGAEKALLTLLRHLSPDEFTIDLQLLIQEGIYLSQIPEYVHLLPLIPAYAAVQSSYGALLKNAFCRGQIKYLLQRLGISLHMKLARNKKRGEKRQRNNLLLERLMPPAAKTYDVAVGYLPTLPIYYVINKVKARRKLGWIHNDYQLSGYNPRLDLPFFAQLDALVTVSPSCETILHQTFPHLADRIQYIPNLLAPDEILAGAKAFRPKEYTPEDMKLLSIGRLAHQKAYDIALEAAALLKRDGFAFKWYIIGRGPLKEEITASIHQKGLDDYCILLGTTPNPYPYLDGCDIFVQASRHEGKSIALEEAKILAKPILISDYPSAQDQLIHEVNGLIVPLTPEAVANGLRRLMENAALRRQFSEALQGERQQYENALALNIRALRGETTE